MSKREYGSDGLINTQSEQYRRGQILGFTMAEIMLVLLFLLLLLLGSKIKQLSEVLNLSFQPGSAEHNSVNALKDELTELKGKGVAEESKDVFWLTERLVLAAEDILSGKSTNTEKQINELIEKNKDLSEQLKDAEKTIKKLVGNKDPEVVTDLMSAMDSAQLNSKEAKQCLLECGGGPKACWGESIRNPDYIYNVGLYDDQLYITPNLENIEKNTFDWAMIPESAKISEPILLSRGQFQTKFSQLLEHARKNDCVYHVRLIDVKTSSKAIYKSQRQLVENNVYITIKNTWNPSEYGSLPQK